MARCIVQMFPDGSSGIIRYNCTYNEHIAQYYMYKMSLAKHIKNQNMYEHYNKQINLEFMRHFMPLPYEIKTELIQVKQITFVQSKIW